MKNLRGVLVASLVVAAPLSAMADQATAPSESLQCTESNLGVAGLESRKPVGIDDNSSPACLPEGAFCGGDADCCDGLTCTEDGINHTGLTCLPNS